MQFMIPHYGGDGNLVVDAHVVTQRLPWRHPSIILRDVNSKADDKKVQQNGCHGQPV